MRPVGSVHSWMGESAAESIFADGSHLGTQPAPLRLVQPSEVEVANDDGGGVVMQDCLNHSRWGMPFGPPNDSLPFVSGLDISRSAHWLFASFPIPSLNGRSPAQRLWARLVIVAATPV